MRAWLITVGEPLPTDEQGDRLLRTGMLAERLVRSGHDVVWWTSAFDHVRKRHRTASDAVLQVERNYRIRLLRGMGYRSNISLRRLVDHVQVARRLRKQTCEEAVPDVILCSLPTVELSVEAVRYARRARVPVVLDIRDLWPELFLDLFPPVARPIARRLLSPLFSAAARACQGATAITGTTDEYVQWGLGYAQREAGRQDAAFPLAYRERAPLPGEIEAARTFWHEQGIRGGDGQFVACFLGAIGRHAEVETVIEAARLLAASGRKVQFVLCGAGPQLAHCRRLAEGCPQVLLPGWVDAAKIWTLLRLSSVGLVPITSNANYVANLPNKPIEYLSAALPIVSSLQGVLARLLERHECGLTYGNRNAAGLAEAIAALYDDPQRRQQMASRAAALYQREFVAERVYARMQDYLENIAQVPRLRRAA